MISVIIASFKEPKTIGRCISCIANKKYSGIPNDFEIIQVSPDSATLNAGRKEANKYKLGKRYIQIKDPRKGKPYALRMAFKKAKGDILILTDGDTILIETVFLNYLSHLKTRKLEVLVGDQFQVIIEIISSGTGDISFQTLHTIKEQRL